jgi:hypothetical protein
LFDDNLLYTRAFAGSVQLKRNHMWRSVATVANGLLGAFIRSEVPRV